VEIIVIVLALAFLQVWGAHNPLHKDQWFFSWLDRIQSVRILTTNLRAFFAIALPLILIGVAAVLLYRVSIWLALPLAVIVLLFSLGRGEFSEIVREYTQACYVENWSSAIHRAQKFHVKLDHIAEGDWPSLHHAVFVEAGYRGFERLFAVLFWFLILGPIGALMYRLVFLANQKDSENELVDRWLWLLEWPVARVVGISFALYLKNFR
jgi:AmpE protein